MVTYRNVIATLSNTELAEILVEDSIPTCACNDIDCFIQNECRFSKKCMECVEKFLEERVSQIIS